MTDQALTAEILGRIVDGIMTDPDLSGDSTWTGYGLAAEVQDDQSTIQAAFRYVGDGSPLSAPTLANSLLLVELRDATRGVDGQAWTFFVLKIHRETGQVGMQFVAGDEVAEWSLSPTENQRLSEQLRPRQEDFDRPIA